MAALERKKTIQCKAKNSIAKRLENLNSKNKTFLANVNVEDEYQHLFSGLGEMAQPYNIVLELEAVLHAMFSPRRVALPLLPKVKVELDKLQELGVTRPGTRHIWAEGNESQIYQSSGLQSSKVWILCILH